MRGCEDEPWELAQLGFCWCLSVPTDNRSLQIQFDRDVIGGIREGLGVKKIILDADTISPELIRVDQCVDQLNAHQ